VRLELRRACPEDEIFLRTLHREAMGPHAVATYGAWDEALQSAHFTKVPLEEQEVLVRDGCRIGCLLLLRRDGAVVLSRIWLTPAEQGKGIGGKLVAKICHDAAVEGLPVRLRVLKLNPARRLYERLGFQTMSQTETHFEMEFRSPNAS
jgi:GNAT superfamily N-acetyltransferase